VRPKDLLGLRAAITVECRPDPGEREWWTILVESEPDNVLLFGHRVRLRSVFSKLFAGTRQRLFGFNHMRQCGDEVLRMLVTGGPGVRGGGGIPQRIMTNSRPVSVLRTTGAGKSGKTPGIGGRFLT
jgi:hypothetical protein